MLIHHGQKHKPPAVPHTIQVTSLPFRSVGAWRQHPSLHFLCSRFVSRHEQFKPTTTNTLRTFLLLTNLLFRTFFSSSLRTDTHDTLAMISSHMNPLINIKHTPQLYFLTPSTPNYMRHHRSLRAATVQIPQSTPQSSHPTHFLILDISLREHHVNNMLRLDRCRGLRGVLKRSSARGLVAPFALIITRREFFRQAAAQRTSSINKEDPKLHELSCSQKVGETDLVFFKLVHPKVLVKNPRSSCYSAKFSRTFIRKDE